MIPGVSELVMTVAGSEIESRVQRAIIQSQHVFGTLVLISAEDFLCIVDHQENPLVVESVRGWIRKRYVYLSSYKGLAFCTKTQARLEIHEDVLLIIAKKAVLPV